MALESIWDTVQDAELVDSLRGGRRLVRTGIVKGISSGDTTSKDALFHVIANAPDMPAKGDAFSPSYPTLLCMHRVARGIPNTGGTMARVWLHYETPGGGGTPIERFAAEDSTVLVAEPTQKIPGTNTALYVSRDSNDPDPNDDTTSLVTITTPRVMRSLILYGLFSDRPNSSVLYAANKVNSATWQGLPVGYWRCEGPRVRYSSRDGMYAVSVGFLTKMDEDWTTYAFPIDPATGRFFKPAQADLDALLGQPYQFGPRSQKNGILAVGPHQTANFSAIFGTSFPLGD